MALADLDDADIRVMPPQRVAKAGFTLLLAAESGCC